MQVEFLSKFSKDIDSISQKSVRSNLSRLIRSFELAENLNHIPNLKKLVGHKSAYRVCLEKSFVSSTYFLSVQKTGYPTVPRKKFENRLTYLYCNLLQTINTLKTHQPRLSVSCT